MSACSPACPVSSALHAHRLWMISSLRNEPRLKIAVCCLLPAHRGWRSLQVLAVIFNVEMFRSQNCLASPASMGSSGDSWRADSGAWFSLHPGLEGEGKKFTLETTSPSSVPALSLLMKGQLTLGGFLTWHLELDQNKIFSGCYTTGKRAWYSAWCRDSLLHVSPTPCHLWTCTSYVSGGLCGSSVYPCSSCVGLYLHTRVGNLGLKLLHRCFLINSQLRACRSLPPFEKQGHRELVPHDDSLIACWPEGLTKA